MSEGEECTTIDHVVERLEKVVAEAAREADRVGLFASLYRQVTVQIAAGIRDGRFEDGPRMSRFDAHFGNRYLTALAAYRAPGRGAAPCPESWTVAFDFAGRPDGAIVQHLVLGVNAHINLDLAVAAARTAPGADLPALRHDYLVVNQILVDTVERLQDRLNEVSPVMADLDRLGWFVDEKVMGWTIVRARASAWRAAEGLAALDREDRELAARAVAAEAMAGVTPQVALEDGPWAPLVRELDRNTARIARRVCRLPVVDGFLERVRRSEVTDVAEAIGVLDTAVER